MGRQQPSLDRTRQTHTSHMTADCLAGTKYIHIHRRRDTIFNRVQQWRQVPETVRDAAAQLVVRHVEVPDTEHQ